MSNAKKRILQRLRTASASLPSPAPLPEALPPVYAAEQESLDLLFATQFLANGGRFVYCSDRQELAQHLLALYQERQWASIHCPEPILREALAAYELPWTTAVDALMAVAASLTTCEALVARTGTVCLSSQTPAGRRWSIVPPVHLVVATTNQLVYELRDVLRLQTARPEGMPSMLCFASTNSRTADIEKTLVNGAHGPKELFVFLLDN